MSILNNTKIILNTAYIIFLLAILAFGIMLTAPTKAEAAYGYSVIIDGNNSGTNQYNPYSYYNTSTYNPYAPATTYYPYNTATTTNPATTTTTTPTVVYSTTVNPKSTKPLAKKVAAKTKTVANTAVATAATAIKTTETSNNIATTVCEPNPINNQDFSTLAASTIFGDNGFMPSGLLSWILLSILILFSVILVRRVYGGHERYHASPMKHK